MTRWAGRFVAVAVLGGLLGADDPLPSWVEGPTRSALLQFVADVTTRGGPGYVEPDDRLAVFDNDGTLWCEQPMYVQAVFVLDRAREMVDRDPGLGLLDPFDRILADDRQSLAQLGQEGFVDLLRDTHSGVTADEFAELVRGWISRAEHPRFHRPYTELAYRPMIELLDYLRANGFKTFVVSGGGIEFMRAWAWPVYGIPPEQIIGSSIRTAYEVRDGRPTIVRLPEIEFIDDGGGKVVGIGKFIGRRPIAAFGNSDGDYEMLRYVTSGPGRTFGLIVHHTDADREYAYDRDSPIGRLDRALDEAPERGWTVVDMKADWRRIFLDAD